MAMFVPIKFLVLCFGITIFLTINTSADGELVPEEEQPAISVSVIPLGGREYLAPNLKSVLNLAYEHLPKSLRLICVIEASREITNLVQYELITKSFDNSNTEVICHIIIKEKPWLSNQYGKKYRFLDYTNCSTYYTSEELDNEVNYQPHAYIQRESETSNRNLENLETQILPKNRHPEENPEDIVEEKKELSKDVGDILDSLFDISPDYAPLKNEDRIDMNVNRNNNEDSSHSLHTDDRHPYRREKRNIYEPKINESKNTFSAQKNINKVALEKRAYNNLKAFLEEYFESAITGEDKYRINKVFEVRNYNNFQQEQEITAELTNKRGDEINCHVKITPNQENKTKKLKVHIFCPNLIDETVLTSQLNEQHSKERKLVKNVHSLFLKYQKKYNKNYNSSELEMRYLIFTRNLAKIDELNENEQGTAVYGITEFADMTDEEYKQRTGLLLGETSNNIKGIVADIPDFDLPTNFDWRKRGVISKVKNQGVCGSCWAFSVTGNIEGLHAIKTGQLEEYSEQELLDCDTVDSACMGGLPDNAYKAIEDLGGLELESEYPYKAKKDKCHMNNTLVHVKVKGAIDLPKNETAMALWLVANGPISIGINANAMQFYRGGISHPWKMLCRAGGVDHGVLIVGYGVKEYPRFNKTLPYWIIKNSWGERWGEQGYYRIYRGDNTCGVNTMASSAILA